MIFLITVKYFLDITIPSGVTDLLTDMASRIIITFHPLTLFTRSNSFFNKADFQITLPETTVFPVSVHGGGKEKI